MAAQSTYKPRPFNPNGMLPSTIYPGLAVAAAFLAVGPAIFGSAVYVNPQLALDSLKIPTPENETDKKRVYAIIKLSAAREMAFGVTTLGIWWFAARRRTWTGYWALGLAMLAKGAMKCSDGFVTQEVVGGGQWQHWVFVPFNTFLGVALLGML